MPSAGALVPVTASNQPSLREVWRLEWTQPPSRVTTRSRSGLGSWADARVSTRDQNPQLQLNALEASGYDTLVQEKESARRGVLRPAWQELLPLPRPGDTLKFWKSDRWDRSAADVLATVNGLRDRGVTVMSLTENFDLGTKEGRLMFGVLALAAEYELELRAERQADGIAAARPRAGCCPTRSTSPPGHRPRRARRPSTAKYQVIEYAPGRS